MIDKKLVPVGGLKKEPFSGVHRGMRYYFCSDDTKENILLYIYPEPWSFEKTPEEEKKCASFPLTDAGMDEAINWLLAEYENNIEKWKTADKNRMHF